MGLDLTGFGSVFDFGSKIIDKIFPDKQKADEAKLAMLKLQQDGQLQSLQMEYAAMAQQAAVNLEEAKSLNMFVSGWRPGIGWICGLGLLYSLLLQPILVGFGVKAPATDMSVIVELLFAMLGVAGMRTYEKINGVASK